MVALADNVFLKNRKFLNDKVKNNFWSYFFMGPGLLLFLIFTVYPLFYALKMSFFSNDTLNPVYVGVANYVELFHNPVFIKSLLNTFKYVLFIVPSVIVISLYLSVIILEKSRAAQTFFRGVFYLPSVISGVSMSLIWLIIYNPNYGIANYFLSLVNLNPISWINSENLVIFSLSIVVLIYSIGQPVILFLASLANIPKYFYEAADLDGATAFQQFAKITLPMLVPTLLYVFITTTTNAFQIYVVIKLMTGGGPNYASSTILYLLIDEAFTFGKFASAAAMGIVLFAMIACFSALQFKFLSKEYEY